MTDMTQSSPYATAFEQLVSWLEQLLDAISRAVTQLVLVIMQGTGV